VATAARAELAVTRYAFARSVEAREPMGVAEGFPADVGRLFFFTQVSGATAGEGIRHVWIYDGREVATVDLPVEAPTWRTWSSKRVLPHFRGDWTVEVRDGAGRVLLTATCRVE
jgi:hypothetical protein